MPKSGQEKRRGCSRCKETTWQTYVVRALLSNCWRCNDCGQETPG